MAYERITIADAKPLFDNELLLLVRLSFLADKFLLSLFLPHLLFHFL